MAKVHVTTTSRLAVKSNEGTQARPDAVQMRVVPSGTGTVWIKRTSGGKNTVADTTTCFYFTETEAYEATLVAGDEINVITDSGTIDIVIDGDESMTFGPAS